MRRGVIVFILILVIGLFLNFDNIKDVKLWGRSLFFPYNGEFLKKKALEYKRLGADELCLGMLTGDGASKYYFWGVKGRKELIDNVCPLNIPECVNRKFFVCYSLKSGKITFKNFTAWYFKYVAGEVQDFLMKSGVFK